MPRLGRPAFPRQFNDVLVYLCDAVVCENSARGTRRPLGSGSRQRVGHRARESDVQVRNVALGKGDDVDAGERQSFEETRGVLLVATEAVERFRQDDVESAVHVADPHAFNAAVTQSTES